MNLLKARLEPA